jgi:hypothetical protein
MALPSSLFVSSEVQSREVDLPDGNKHTLYFKALPAVEFRKFQLAEFSNDDDVKAQSMSRLIASSLCESDGKLALTIKDAERLHPLAANSLVTAILDINGFGQKKD